MQRGKKGEKVSKRGKKVSKKGKKKRNSKEKKGEKRAVFFAGLFCSKDFRKITSVFKINSNHSFRAI